MFAYTGEDNHDVPHAATDNNVDSLCSDTDWARASMVGDRRSISGRCVVMNLMVLPCPQLRAHKAAIALSSCEAELISAVSALQEGILWTQITNRDCNITIYMDSLSARPNLQR